MHLEKSFKDILSKLSEIEPYSPDWNNEQFDGFLAALQQLREHKLAERSQANVAFAAALEKLREFRKLLTYLHLPILATLEANQFQCHKLMEASEGVAHLCRLLIEYHQTRSETPSDYTEEKHRFERLVSLHAEVHAVATFLQSIKINEIQSGPAPESFNKQSTSGGDEATTLIASNDSAAQRETPAVQAPSSDRLAEPQLVDLSHKAVSKLTPTDSDTVAQDLIQTSTIVSTSEGQVEPLTTTKYSDQVEDIVDPPLTTHVDASEDFLPEHWHSIVSHYLDIDDLPGAYWLVRGLKERGIKPPVEPHLLAAVQGGRWIDGETGMLAEALLDISTELFPDPYDEAQTILGLAAALRPILLAPACGVGDWLVSPECPSLQSLTKVLTEFHRIHGQLQLQQLPTAQAQWEINSCLAEAQSAVMDWSARVHNNFVNPNTSLRTNVKIETMPRVVSEWMKPDGALGSFVEIVRANRLGEQQSIRNGLQEWHKDKYVIDMFRQRSAQLRREKNIEELYGTPKRNLLESIKEGVWNLERWTDVALRVTELVNRSEDWTVTVILDLRHDLEVVIPAALAEIATKRNTSGLSAFWHCLENALLELAALFGLGKHGAKTKLLDKQWYCAGANNLEAAMVRRLIWVPDVILDDSGFPMPGQWDAILAALSSERTGPDITKTVERWIAAKDFRFVNKLLLSNCEDLGELLRSKVQQQIELCRAQLNRERATAAALVEQGLIDGFIRDEERTLYLEVLTQPRTDTVADFRKALQEVAEVMNQVNGLRDSALEQLRGRWDTRKGELVACRDVRTSVRDRVIDKIESAFASRQLRIVDEWLNVVGEALDEGAEPEARIQDFEARSSSRMRDALLEFQKHAPELEEYIKATNAGIGSLIESLEMGISPKQVPMPDSPDRRNEIKRAIELWQKLKLIANPTSEDAPRNVLGVLQFIGFAVPIGGEGELSRTVSAQSNHLYLTARRTATELSPLPRFGSRTEGVYKVLCLWKMPEVRTIEQTLRLLEWDNNSHLVILYLGVLDLRSRNAIASLCRRERLPLAILDELLLLFLAGEPDYRLGTFFDCALPYSFINPYTKDPHAPVDAEMFVGRKSAIELVADFNKSCIVFGGRQLGKTAVLRRVKALHNRENKLVIYQSLEFLKKEFEDGYPGAIWDLIDRKLREEGVILESQPASKAETVHGRIIKALREKPLLRILLLLDEVDDFLNADNHNGFRVVAQLRDLMIDCDRRVKVVLSGNFHTQRFASGNHPLTPFGDPIFIKQMSYSAARELVERPARALGFRFQDETVVPRILSYTFYYAGLVQLFMHELLEQCRIRLLDSTEGPVYLIDGETVDELARNPEVRRKLRDRFRMTMDLDEEYAALVFSLVLSGPGIAGLEQELPYFTSEEILEIGRKTWPLGFRNTSLDTMKVRLLEMRGLGLLVTDQAGSSYRLRSPDLVRLFGSRRDVERELNALTARDPRAKMAFERKHSRLGTKPERYSPFTRAQERLLMPTRTGVNLVFASDALGSQYLAAGIESLIRGEEIESGAVEVPRQTATGRHIREYVVQKLRDSDKYRSLLFYKTWTDGSGQALLEAALEAQLISKDIPLKGRNVRLVFLLGAMSCWNWLSLGDYPFVRGIKAEKISYIGRWDEYAIQRRLEDLDLDLRREVREEILRVTGGWPMLLDLLFDRLPTEGDPIPAILGFETQLLEHDATIKTDFLNATGLYATNKALPVLRWLCRQGSVPEEFWTPELVLDGELADDSEAKLLLSYLVAMGCADIHVSTKNELEIVPEKILARICMDSTGK